MNLYDLWIIKTGKVELSAHQERRKNLLTSSDAAILLGCHPFAYRPQRTIEDDAAIQLGKLLERPVLRWGARSLGQRIIRNQFRVCKRDRLYAAQHDALSLTDPSQGFEAKTSGLRGPPAYRDQWGEPGTDQVPYHILAQCQWQALVSELDVVWIPALIGGRGHMMYRVERNKDLVAMLEERAHTFWEEHVLADVPPDGEPPSLNLIKIARRERGKTISLPGWKAAADWRRLDAEAKVAEKAADKAKAKMLAEMGDAEEAETDDGVVQINRIPVARLDTKTLKEKEPKIAEKYVMHTEQRRVTWKEKR